MTTCPWYRHVLLLFVVCLGTWPLRAADSLLILKSGSQPGHYLTWNGKPQLLIGDSVP